MSERLKGDGGFYAFDQVPLINCFDFFFWNENGKKAGWSRKMILDSWNVGADGGMQDAEFKDGKGKFLYDSGANRKFANHLSEIISFQFADLSAVAPFRYHSVRSLGFLVYAVCHLQNRLRCRFSESVFESTMNYFRVKDMEDADRALYLNMVNKGFVDESIQFVPAAERWQVNAQLIELGLGENQRLIEQNAASYAQPQNYSKDKTQKTKFEIMAEIQSSTTLVTSALNQAYAYQTAEYREIMRRFFRPNSTDPDVREFRAACLRQDVPEKLLNIEYWEIQPSRVVGAGNKTLQMAITEQLMAMRPLYDPESQREILRASTFNITDDAAWAESLVPDEPLKISDSVHDAQLAMGSLMQGLPVAVKTGQNHAEYIQVLLAELGMLIEKCQKQGGMATPQQIEGFQNVAQHVSQHLQILGQDKSQKAAVAAFGKQLGKLMNMVKAFMQRLQQAMKKRQQQSQKGNGADPQAAAKIQATVMNAQVKAKNATESHAQRTAQKQVAWEAEQKRKQMEFEHELRRENLRTAEEVRHNRMKSLEEE